MLGRYAYPDCIHSERFFPKILLVLVNYFAVAFLVATVQPQVLRNHWKHFMNVGIVDTWKSQVLQRQSRSGDWTWRRPLLLSSPFSTLFVTEDRIGGLRMMYMQVSSKHPVGMWLGTHPTLWSGNSWHPTFIKRLPAFSPSVV